LKYLSTVNNPNSLFLEPITKGEIKSYILNSKDKTSFNRNGLSNYILKQISDYILIPLEHIFNLALVTGSFPNIFKQTLIVPIFKSGDKKCLLKLSPNFINFYTVENIGKCIKTRLTNFLEKSFAFSDNQFGFRNNKATSKAVQTLISCINNKLDDGNKVL